MTTPRIEVIARGLSIHRGRVLLCRNTGSGYMYLPGGHVEFSEPAAWALTREFDEEAGIAITVGDLLRVGEHSFLSGSKRHHEINLVFHVEQIGGVDLAGDQGDPPAVESREPDIAFEWVDLAGVTDLDIRPLECRAWLAAGAPSDPGRPLSGMALPIEIPESA